ncbi:MAG: prepilin peptidase [Solirubrobacteraceae bacterium]
MSLLKADIRRPARLDALVLAAVLVAADLATDHSTAGKVLGAFLVVVLVTATVTDLRRRKIPNWLTLPAAAWALVLGLILHPSGLPGQALAGLAAGGFMFVFAVLYPKGLGMGDVKLTLAMGLYLSASVAVALVVGLICSALAGLFVIRREGFAKGRKRGLPLAPFLAVGGVVAILAGPEIVHWYVHSQSLGAILGGGLGLRL